MTPQEKSKELVKKFSPIVNGGETITFVIRKAVKCAIIAVDGIIDALSEIHDRDVRGNVLLDLLQYWKSVKTELEKL